jgi:hypothetical protein
MTTEETSMMNLIVALGMSTAVLPGVPAPAGAPNALYCLRMEPITGTRIGTIECRTRDDWAQLEVDVDEEWSENGVRILA